MIIKDGSTGYSAEVSSYNRLLADSVEQTRISFYAKKGKAYIWTAFQDWGADKNAIWLRNDSETEKLYIDKISISPPATATVEVYVGSGNTAGGTDVTGVNLNLSSNNVANVTCKHTNTNVDTGTGMTLIATFIFLAGYNNEIDLRDTPQLGKNDEIAINIVTDVSTTAVNIIGYFEE